MEIKDISKERPTIFLMNKLTAILSAVLLLCTSCAEQYNIAGNSTMSCLDGRMLYLRVTPEGASQKLEASSICIDSCEVVHGRFNFAGDVDSTMMVMMFTQNQCVMPIVIEDGNLNIQVDNAGQRVTGGPLNEKLYKFFRKHNRIENEMWQIQQQTMRMMRAGQSPESIHRKFGKKVEKLTRESEELETKFVMDNYDNVLGPGFFMLLCNQYPTPILTPQIERIAVSATPQFLSNPYVRNWLRQAKARKQRVTTTFNTELYQ